jgi:hypothetical protein
MTVPLLLERAPSLAVRLRLYVPGALNEAVVESADKLPNVTTPGPLATLQVWVSFPEGRPSSVAVPVNWAEAGSVIV